MNIDKKYLEQKLKLATDAYSQAREQVQKWDAIARQNEGAINAINSILKEIKENKIDNKKQLEK